MRLNLYLRGIDLVDVEFHFGSKGVYLDVNWFAPREESSASDPVPTTADLTSTSSGVFERVNGPVWQDDQPVVVRGFGFQRSDTCPPI